MNRTKIFTRVVSILFPAAGLYFCWWLRESAGEVLAGIAFVVLCVNYFWIMRKKKLQNKNAV